MKWLRRIVVAVAAVIALLLVIGMLLPSGFKVQRSVQVAAPPSKIYPLIVEPRQWKNSLVGPDFEGGLKNLKSLAERG